MIHALKILPEFFKAMAAGTKSFEVRKNDRPYHTGDYVALNEWRFQYMTENKEIIKAGGVFITHRTREAIYATAAQRTEPELKECFTMLHDSMDRFGKQIAVEEITGQDFIIYTPERRIGKTEAALYLAHEYNMPYLVKLAQLDFVKRQAKEAGYNIKFVPLSRPQIEGMRLRTILKDECIKTKEAREYIGKYINIIGIEEI